MASIGDCILGLARGVARWTCRKAAIVYAGCMAVQFEEKIALQSDYTRRAPGISSGGVRKHRDHLLFPNNLILIRCNTNFARRDVEG
jgi:hypothetical protein